MRVGGQIYTLGDRDHVTWRLIRREAVDWRGLLI